ncbi:MAG: hypothetical protein ACOCPU_03725 [Methanohalophilus sp.]
MGDSEGFDQSMIDDLVASAESDTPESRIENLEAEVNEIKGSVKALLMDIRETMSVLENPFQDIQAIANITAQDIASTPAQPEEDLSEEPEPPSQVEPDPVEQNIQPDLFENNTPLQKPKPGELPDFKLVDPLSFYKTIVWGREMVEKYDYETIQELVEIFSLLGYIPDDIKEIVLKIMSILYEDNDLENAVTDLYRLYHILNPEDKTLDSKVLDYVLNESNTVNNPWQGK